MPAAWEVEDEQDLDTGSTAPSVRVVVPPVSSAAASHVQPAFENNNPGNLEYRGQPGATQNGRYAQFARPEDGYQAMQDQIDLDSKRGSTLGDYIRKYARRTKMTPRPIPGTPKLRLARTGIFRSRRSITIN